MKPRTDNDIHAQTYILFDFDRWIKSTVVSDHLKKSPIVCSIF